MDMTNMMGIGSMGLPAWSLWFLLIFAWSLFWKGFALWFAAQRGEKWWFIVFLVVNTAGVLEIVYIFFVARIHEFRKRLGLR